MINIFTVNDTNYDVIECVKISRFSHPLKGTSTKAIESYKDLIKADVVVLDETLNEFKFGREVEDIEFKILKKRGRKPKIKNEKLHELSE
jgi:hypothetical protein